MSFANPTPIRLNMSGTIAGKTYRVVGRVVLGMEEDGRTYYWNEFNLRGSNGEEATLVYEETESGPAWRLFTELKPRRALSVAEAERMRVGDLVDLEDRPLRVTCVDESRIYFIEGQAPEGEEVGDVAHYFNAGNPNRMVVVSWTGDEIEYYQGFDLLPNVVAAAFGLDRKLFRSPSLIIQPTAPARYPARTVIPLVLMFFIGIIVFSTRSCHYSSRPRPLTKPPTPPAPLSLGDTGRLDGRSFTIRGQTLVEIAQVNQLYDRHEYYLVDDDGTRALLAFASKPGADDALLLTQFYPDPGLTPQAAAALRVGDIFNFDGPPAKVTSLCRVTLRQVKANGLPELESGVVYYSFQAQAGTTNYLLRWNESTITGYEGKSFPAKEVLRAFHK